jgi:hypothetical protein
MRHGSASGSRDRPCRSGHPHASARNTRTRKSLAKRCESLTDVSAESLKQQVPPALTRGHCFYQPMEGASHQSAGGKLPAESLWRPSTAPGPGQRARAPRAGVAQAQPAQIAGLPESDDEEDEELESFFPFLSFLFFSFFLFSFLSTFFFADGVGAAPGSAAVGVLSRAAKLAMYSEDDGVASIFVTWRRPGFGCRRLHVCCRCCGSCGGGGRSCGVEGPPSASAQ